MAAFTPLSLFLLVCISLLVAAAPPPPPPPPPSPYATVAFQWPMAVCQVDQCTGKLLPQEFRLHGVWPTYGNHSPMTFCQSFTWSNSALNSIRTDLTRLWPSYIIGSNQVFWQEQWDKHGSCSGMSVFDYFDASLKLFRVEYKEIFNALKNHNINPAPITDVRVRVVPFVVDIYNAIVADRHLIPIIRCKKDYMVEIRLCATADLKRFQNCTRPHRINLFVGCGPKALFYSNPKADFEERVPNTTVF